MNKDTVHIVNETTGFDFEYEPCPEAYVCIKECSEVTKVLVRKLIERDLAGKQKYGTSLDRTDLTREQWLDHMTEELLDAAGYAQSAKR